MKTSPQEMTWSTLLDELELTPARLAELTSGAEHEVTCWRPEPTGWSVCENIAHMCAVESPYRARLVHMTLQENPRVATIDRILGGFDPETPLSILLDTFARLRADTVAFLRRLPPASRARTAQHAMLGPVTLRGQVEALLTHDFEHLAAISQALQGARNG